MPWFIYQSTPQAMTLCTDATDRDAGPDSWIETRLSSHLGCGIYNPHHHGNQYCQLQFKLLKQVSRTTGNCWGAEFMR